MDKVKILKEVWLFSRYDKFLLHWDFILNPCFINVHYRYLVLVAMKEEIKVAANIKGTIKFVTDDVNIVWIGSYSLD
jgi:hypothetical protein